MQRKRKTPPLTFGEYDSPEPGQKHAVWTARQHLMARVAKTFPRMLENLRDSAFGDLQRSPHPNPAVLRPKCAEWAARFHADEPWLIDDAVETLRLWLRSEDALRSLRWLSTKAPAVLMTYTRDFEFSCSRWEPELVAWPRYSHALWVALKKAVQTYEEEMRQKAEALGRVRVSVNFSLQDLDWFVLYRFKGWSSNRIANYVAERSGKAPDPSTILKGIKAAKQLIDWSGTLRPSRTEQ